jgi:hypothetical protein
LITNWLPAWVEAPLLEKVLSVTTRSVSVPLVFLDQDVVDVGIGGR